MTNWLIEIPILELLQKLYINRQTDNVNPQSGSAIFNEVTK